MKVVLSYGEGEQGKGKGAAAEVNFEFSVDHVGLDDEDYKDVKQAILLIKSVVTKVNDELEKGKK